MLYYHGQGVPQDYAKAAYWYDKAAAQGFARADYILGVLYERGQGTPQNYIEAYKYFVLAKAAAYDDEDAEYNLDGFYDHSQGVPQDYLVADQWYFTTKLGTTPDNTLYQSVAHAMRNLSSRMTPAQIAQAQSDAEKLYRTLHH